MILEEDCLNENKFSETVLVTYFDLVFESIDFQS